MKFFHITSPVIVPPERDLFYAQPVTFNTFKIAKQFCSKKIFIEQACVCYEEDKKIVPNYLKTLDFLKLSIKDFGDYKFKFPLIKEILDIAYQSSRGFDYIIFSNVDISLMPYFYETINNYIDLGYDSIIVNRRSIDINHKKIKDIPLMFSKIGEKHVGWDCFIFKRELYKKFEFGNGVIGAVGSGRILQSNLRFFSKNFIELKNSQLTFHLGISPTTTRQYSDIEWVKTNLFNNSECEKIIDLMFSMLDGKSLEWLDKRYKKLKIRKVRYKNSLHPPDKFFGYWHLKRFISFINKKLF